MITLNSLHGQYLPPWPSNWSLYSHWTNWGSQPCSHTHHGRSIEPSGGSDTYLHLSPCPAAGTWRTAWLYSLVLGGKDGVWAFEPGGLPTSPAETQHAVSLGVIPTGQGDTVHIEANNITEGIWEHCGRQQLIRVDDSMHFRIVILKC